MAEIISFRKTHSKCVSSTITYLLLNSLAFYLFFSCSCSGHLFVLSRTIEGRDSLCGSIWSPNSFFLFIFFKFRYQYYHNM